MNPTETNLEAQISGDKEPKTLLTVRNMVIGGTVLLLAAGGVTTYIYRDMIFGGNDLPSKATASANSKPAQAAPQLVIQPGKNKKRGKSVPASKPAAKPKSKPATNPATGTIAAPVDTPSNSTTVPSVTPALNNPAVVLDGQKTLPAVNPNSGSSTNEDHIVTPSSSTTKPVVIAEPSLTTSDGTAAEIGTLSALKPFEALHSDLISPPVTDDDTADTSTGLPVDGGVITQSKNLADPDSNPPIFAAPSEVPLRVNFDAIKAEERLLGWYINKFNNKDYEWMSEKEKEKMSEEEKLEMKEEEENCFKTLQEFSDRLNGYKRSKNTNGFDQDDLVKFQAAMAQASKNVKVKKSKGVLTLG